MEPQNKSGKKIGIIISAVVVIIVGAVFVFSRKGTPTPVTTDQNSTENSNPTTSTTSQIPPVDNTKKAVYKDGTYSATGSYMSPGGLDHFGVTLTLKNDVVTDISATPGAGDKTSEKYQAKFISGYKALVIGKNINEVNLTKVSGSSLTPKGFNDAIAQIKVQAKS